MMLSDDAANGGSWLSNSHEDTLQRIADALGATKEVFHGESFEQNGSRQPTATQEGLALLEAFGRISDPQARRRCLTYVQEAAAMSCEQRMEG